jgi:fused signal recognition particle receptor
MVADENGKFQTKLDGTAKGGSLFGIAKALELPIIYVGVGEGRDDLIPFNADDYIDTILDSIFTTNNG